MVLVQKGSVAYLSIKCNRFLLLYLLRSHVELA